MKIRVEINCMELPKWVDDDRSYKAWICSQLKEAGIPIIKGPLLPEVDFSKGNIETWDDYATGKKIYVWRGNDL
jgi:hypothetical protein